MEIAGHEFWSYDGQEIWYDLQTPKGQDFWVGGYNVQTGERTWYHLQRNEWSIHFTVSRDAPSSVETAAIRDRWRTRLTANGSTCSTRS